MIYYLYPPIRNVGKLTEVYRNFGVTKAGRETKYVGKT